MIFFPLITAIVLLGSGLYALIQNRWRPTNQILAAVCFVACITQILQVIARKVGDQYWIDHLSNPMPWVRWRFSMIGILCPLLAWACYYIVSGKYVSRSDLLRKLSPWVAISCVLAVLPFTEAFKASASRPDHILNGPLFTPYLLVILVSLILLCVSSIGSARRLQGIQALEFKCITIPFAYLGLGAIAGTLLNQIFPQFPAIEAFVKVLSFLVFLAFGISAWSITSHRIYHSTQLFVPIVERAAVLALMGFLAVWLLRQMHWFDNSAWASAGVIALTCAGFLYLDERLRSLLHLKSEQRTAVVAEGLRKAAVSSETPERLASAFETILGVFANGIPVRIFGSDQNRFVRDAVTFIHSDLEATPMQDEGWVSIASLVRIEPTKHTESILATLRGEGLHLLVGPALRDGDANVIIAFGERENRVPFTHPEIKVLVALSELANALYTKCRLALQARQAAQLATIGLVGAGIAHELRGPMSAINTFAQLLPGRIDDQAFLREFADIVPGEAKRIENLADQLLDLSRPRQYDFVAVDLNSVVTETTVLMRRKADASGIRLTVECGAVQPAVKADPGALRQVLLNLIQNAIQSIGATGRDGAIQVKTSDEENAVAVEVIDTGAGIPESIYNRLFRPFASSGHPGGLGLGLAICFEIVRVHRGLISAVNKHEGGAVFRFVIPKQNLPFDPRANLAT